ncbi:MAG: insulinase family protein [Spirochaetaceae bacterium]|jgi:zinc protease|nr:insulinase family protein [Spirochaetaceae bacterium]
MLLNKLFFKAAAFAVCVVFAGCVQKYGSLGNAGTQVPLNSNVREGVLPSGLKYYILENKKPENRAFITLAVNAGSVLEEDDEQGLAHFVEHMAFDGTEHFPGTEVVEYLRSLGMRFGAHVNAYTSFDRTVYGITVPVSTNDDGKKVMPERALQIIDDWTHAITFTQKDVDEERPIILEEERLRRGAMNRALRVFFPMIFEGSKYAERLPIGLPDVIKSAPPERLRTFYEKWYRADNMALIFVGDFDGEELEKTLAGTFTMPAARTPLNIPEYDLPPPEKGKIVAEIFTDPELTMPDISLYYKRQWSEQGNTLKDFRNLLIDSLIVSMIGERFTSATYDPDTPYFDAVAGNQRITKRSLHYLMGATAKSGLIKETLCALLRQKESIERFGFLKSEIERAKETLLSDFETAVAEREKTNSSTYVDLLTEMFLSENPFPDVTWRLDAARVMFQSVNAEEIHKAVKDYFSSDDLLVFIDTNTKDEGFLPSLDEIVEIVYQSKKEKIEKPKENTISGELLDSKPKNGKIISEDIDKESDTVIWKLSNGVKVLLKSTENQNEQIVMSAAARGGITNAPPQDLISVKFADEIVNASGYGKWELPEIIKKLAGKQVSLSFNTDMFTRSIEGFSTIGDIKTFFELLYMGFTAPRIDEKTAGVIKDTSRTRLAQHSDSPEGVFSDEITKIAHSENPYFMPVTVEDLEKINLDTIKTWTARCRNPSDYTFVFVGNIDNDVMRPLVETYLASIPDGTPFGEWKNPNIIFPRNVDKAVYKGKEEKSYVYMGHLGVKTWSMEDSMTADMLSEYLNIVLIQEIREKRGGVYSVSPNLTLSPLFPPGELALQVYFACDPNRVNELDSAIEAELAKIASGAISNETFNKAKLALIKNWESSMQSDNYISRRFSSYAAIFNIPLSYVYKRPEFYENVTAASMQALMKEVLQNGLVRAVLYPER